MKNILELLYDQPGGVQAQDSPFVRTARIKNENMEMLNDTLSDEQKELAEQENEQATERGLPHGSPFFVAVNE